MARPATPVIVVAICERPDSNLPQFAGRSPETSGVAGTQSACDSQAVVSGRGITLLTGVAATAVLALVPAAGGADPVAEVSAEKPPLRFFKTRVRSDGSVTPGQQEWVSVSRVPPRAKLKVAIEPPPTTLQCGQYYFCRTVRVFPVPGTPAYRSSGKGRASLSFVMPSHYVIQSDPFRPSTKQSVPFANGQSVHINVLGKRRTRKANMVGFGFARTVVYIPPA